MTPLPCVLVVMGVSGSGKTTVGALVAARLQWEFADADWFHSTANVDKMHAGTALTDDDRRPWLAALAEWIDGMRQAGRHGVLACSALKRRYRDVLRAGGEDVRFTYLKGDQALLARRLAAREEHFMPAALLRSQLETLEEPGPDENPVTVNIDARPSEIAARILAALNA